MHSSTSSSKTSAARWALAIFLVMVVAYVGFLELVTRRKLATISRIHNRMYSEYQAAKVLRPKPGGRSALLTGSSLLNASISIPTLELELEPKGVHVRRWLVEQTSYYDWWYGLRHIFADGARPNEVWITMAPQELVIDSILGEFGAFYVYQASDVPDLIRTLSIAPTPASGLILASYSEFYGLRNDIRKVMLGRLLPGFADLRLMFIGKGQDTLMPREQAVRVARERLIRIKELCRQHGATLHYVMPAAGKVSYMDEVKEGARQARVDVWEPAPLGTYSPKDFSDGYHLNLELAPAFTRKLAQMVLE
jgi:hypothetical protein